MVPKIIYLIAFLEFFNFGLLMPVSSVRILSLGGNKVVVGLISSLGCLLQLLFGPLVGSWSDTKGRKPLLIAGFIASTVANFLVAYEALSIFILGRIICGIFCHVPTLLKALIVDHSSLETQTSALGKFSALIGLSFLLSPIIGGYVTEMENGFNYLSYLMCTISSLTLGLSYCLPEEHRAQPKDTKEKEIGLKAIFSKFSQIDWKIFGEIFFFKFLTETTCGIYHNSFGLILRQEFKSTRIQIGYIISIYSLSMILASLSSGFIKRRIYANDPDCKKRIFHGLAALSSLFTGLYFLPYFWSHVFFLLPFSLVKNLLDSSLNENALSKTNEMNKGTVIGAFDSLLPLTGLFVPTCTGILNHIYGYQSTILLCIFPPLVALGLKVIKKDTKDVKKD